MTTLRIGYVALTDAAVLIAASEIGFARAEGLELILEREESWAAIRDKLVYGFIDGAHLLAPLAIATSLGLSGAKAPLAAPFALNLNGNAITVSTALWREMAEQGAGEDARSAALALGAVARRRRARGADPLTVGDGVSVLDAYLPAAAVPRRRRPCLRAARAPRDGAAGAYGGGAAHRRCRRRSASAAPGTASPSNPASGASSPSGPRSCRIAPKRCWPCRAPAPKAQPGPAPWCAPCGRAAAWCADAGHRGELARLLGKREHLDLDPALIRRSLDGRLIVDAAGTLRIDPAYLALGGEAHRPRPEHARWLVERMIEAGQAKPADRERAGRHLPARSLRGRPEGARLSAASLGAVPVFCAVQKKAARTVRAGLGGAELWRIRLFPAPARLAHILIT